MTKTNEMTAILRVMETKDTCYMCVSLILDLVNMPVCVCVFTCLPFSLPHTRPRQLCDPPRSGLPPPCGPAGSRVRGNTRSGPYCFAASQPGRDPIAGQRDRTGGWWDWSHHCRAEICDSEHYTGHLTDKVWPKSDFWYILTRIELLWCKSGYQQKKKINPIIFKTEGTIEP